jgi:hypothetical protein
VMEGWKCGSVECLLTMPEALDSISAQQTNRQTVLANKYVPSLCHSHSSKCVPFPKSLTLIFPVLPLPGPHPRLLPLSMKLYMGHLLFFKTG